MKAKSIKEKTPEEIGTAMIGLFSFGEIGRNAEGQSESYNLACPLALLNEIE